MFGQNSVFLHFEKSVLQCFLILFNLNIYLRHLTHSKEKSRTAEFGRYIVRSEKMGPSSVLQLLNLTTVVETRGELILILVKSETNGSPNFCTSHLLLQPKLN